MKVYVDKAKLQEYTTKLTAKFKTVFALKGETATDAQVAEAVTDWLDTNVNPVGSAVVVDSTLSVTGAAADAKKTGDEIGDLKNAITRKVENSALSFNVWDEEWKLVSTHIESKNFIPIIGNTKYYLYCATGYGASNGIEFYDESYTKLSTIYNQTSFTTPLNAKYLLFKMASGYGTTYGNNICLNIDQPDTSIIPHNGQYVSYDRGLDTYHKIQDNTRRIGTLEGNNIDLLKTRSYLSKSKNRFDANGAKSGYYNASGVYTSNASYCYCEIDVNVGDVCKFYFLQKYNSSMEETVEIIPRILNMPYVCGFDENGNFVSGSGATNPASYTVPQNVKKIIVSTSKGGTGQIGRNYLYTMVLINNTDYPPTFIPYIEDAYVHDENYYDYSPVKKNVLYGKKGVFFGDSITEGIGVSVGYGYDSSLIDIGKPFPEIVGEITKADVINCGFGGTRYCYMTNTDASFPLVADAIVSENYASLQTYIDNSEAGHNKQRKQKHLDALKNTNFSEVDFIVLAYGTNDWASGITLDNSSNPLDKTTILGGMRYGIDKLLTAFPTLKIFVLTPIYRYFVTGSLSDSDIVQVNGVTLRDVSNAIIMAANNEHAPCKNMYGECNINRYNYNDLTPGGVHPNDKGYILMGEIVSGFLESNY